MTRPQLIVSMRVTLDGFIAGPNGEMDWMEEFFDESLATYESELQKTVDTTLLVVSLLTVDVEAKEKLSTERGTEKWRRRKSPQQGHSAGTKRAQTMDKSAKGRCAKAVGRTREDSATSVKRAKKPGQKPREQCFTGIVTVNRRLWSA